MATKTRDRVIPVWLTVDIPDIAEVSGCVRLSISAIDWGDRDTPPSGGLVEVVGWQIDKICVYDGNRFREHRGAPLCQWVESLKSEALRRVNDMSFSELDDLMKWSGYYE